MKAGLKKLLVGLVILSLLTGCSTTPSGSEAQQTSDADFENFDKAADSTTTQAAPSEESALDQEVAQANEGQSAPETPADAQPAEQPQDAFAEFEEPQVEQPQEVTPVVVEPDPVPTPEVLPEAPQEVVEAPAPEPIPEAAPEQPAPEVAPVADSGQVARITGLKYRANDGGGVLVVEANAPIQFTTRVNAETNQFVIEIPNSKLSPKAKRALNTRDIPGYIGSVNAYQAAGSTTSRIVVQLRQGAGEPTVQPEGNSLLVAANAAPAPVAQPEPEEPEVFEDPKILSQASLEQFLTENGQYFGKKISIEVTDAEVKDVISFISEESGVNLVIADDVKGKISIKLRQVPWDQALVVIMRARKLGYTRHGSVLRIAKVSDIKDEEETVAKSAKAREATAPLVVRMISLNYLKVDEVTKQIQPFLTDRGKVVTEARNSAVVISDIQEAVDRAVKLIQSLDVMPPQVLIEGKVVEASTNFRRAIGLNWGFTGQTQSLGKNSRSGNVNFRPSFNQTTSSSSVGSFGFTLGTLDMLGDLTATLALEERQDNVKVISSPRILTMHNEPAEINQSTEIPIVQDTVVNGVTQSTATFKPVKLKLNVTPLVTNDGNVIMGVDVMREFLSGEAEAKTKARPVNQRSAKTKVLVRNGQTAVIGGIYQSDVTESERRVPGLANIPILGYLFKGYSKDEQKNELLIFLTPRIVGQADANVETEIK